MTDDFVNATTDDYGANKIARSPFARALYFNPIAIAEGDVGAPRIESKGIIATEVEFTSSSTFNPAAFSDYTEAVAHFHIWAGGGGAAHGTSSSSSATGGGGGGYFYCTKKLTDISGTVAVVVGAGGTGANGGNGTTGGDSYVTINGQNFGARGGERGILNNLGVSGGGNGGGFFLGSLTFDPSTNEDLGTPPPHLYSGGHGGTASSSGSLNGGNSFHGGGGGGGASRDASPTDAADGGVSASGGDGGDGVITGAANNGSSPGGGGGASVVSGGSGGDGANGIVLIEIIGMRS